jgi:hypothetical protein
MKKAPLHKEITAECDQIKALLLKKNAAYGNSATDPVMIFSQATPAERIRQKIDDKLSRVLRGDPESDEEDPRLDLIGHLVLLRIIEK